MFALYSTAACSSSYHKQNFHYHIAFQVYVDKNADI